MIYYETPNIICFYLQCKKLVSVVSASVLSVISSYSLQTTTPTSAMQMFRGAYNALAMLAMSLHLRWTLSKSSLFSLNLRLSTTMTSSTQRDRLLASQGPLMSSLGCWGSVSSSLLAISRLALMQLYPYLIYSLIKQLKEKKRNVKIT